MHSSSQNICGRMTTDEDCYGSQFALRVLLSAICFAAVESRLKYPRIIWGAVRLYTLDARSREVYTDFR